MDFKFDALHNLLPYIILLAAAATAVAGQALPGCRTSCGDLNITYPFGVGEGCYRDENFRINCSFSSGTPIANYSTGNIQVLNISLDGELTASGWVASRCFNSSGYRIYGQDSSFGFNQFTISSTKNKFYVVGCDSYAFIDDYWGRRFSTGCTSSCKNKTDVTKGSCAGIGCCETIFPEGNMGYNITVKSYRNHVNVSSFNPCTYAFVAEDGSYNFSTLDLQNLRNKRDFPLVINWAIGTENCTMAGKNTTAYACKENSYCENSQNPPGYLCKCKSGYQGNPYLNGSNGCQDVDECKTMNPCSIPWTCQNLPGNYSCHCPRRYKGDGYKKGEGCTLKSKKLLITQIALGVTAGLLVLVVLMSSLCWVHKQRTIEQLRRKHFKQNGGLILEERFSERTKTFKEVELKKATNNFHESRIIGRGGHGVVYKGILPDNTTVAVKKSTTEVGLREVNDFINEMIVLSQISHRNVVNLLGFCLETEVPLLVYEFVSNGTLLHHIDPRNECTISWETRLRIATDTAEAISYLHSSASIPIIHRDIKSTNILLDQNNKAKVSDFGASRIVSLDENPFATLVQGTPGYLDPEYLRTTQLNEKSDVYSFGVVLMELLTGKKAVEFNKEKRRKYLVMEFVCLMEEGRLLELLDKRVMNERNEDQLKKVALLAERCVKMKGNERPSMKEVAAELDGLIIEMEKHTCVKGDVIPKDNEHLLGEASSSYGDTGIGNSAGDDSIQNQMPLEIGNGR